MQQDDESGSDSEFPENLWDEMVDGPGKGRSSTSTCIKFSSADESNGSNQVASEPTARAVGFQRDTARLHMAPTDSNNFETGTNSIL